MKSLLRISLFLSVLFLSGCYASSGLPHFTNIKITPIVHIVTPYYNPVIRPPVIIPPIHYQVVPHKVVPHHKLYNPHHNNRRSMGHNKPHHRNHH